MSNPKIISISYSVPQYEVDQETAFNMLAYPRQFKKIFMAAGIDKRYFCIPLDVAKTLSWQEQQNLYAKHALSLSSRAIVQAMDGREYDQIGCVIYDSCTGFVNGPSLAHRLATIFPFPKDAYFTNISGHGCESSAPGLKRALDFVKSDGRQALVVNCELSSLAYFPEPKIDPTNDFELARSCAIFGDAAASILVGMEDSGDWRHPEILGTETTINTDYIDDLGFVWQDGRLRCRLSKRVAEVAAQMIKPSLERLLKRFDLKVSDIQWWVVHAAGSRVIDRVRDELSVPEEKLTLSRETLRLFGNTSSTSVGLTGKRLMSENIKQGDYVVMVNVGPGLVSNAILMRFS